MKRSVKSRRAVTVLATRRARPGRAAELTNALENLRQALERQPGHRGTAILPPEPDNGDAVVVYRFAAQQDLETWRASADRATLIEDSAIIAEHGPPEEVESALGGWFAPTGGQVVRPPPRWKTWLVSSIVIWALLVVVTALTSAMLASWAPAARLAVLVPITSATMTWVIMPIITRVLHPWFFQD